VASNSISTSSSLMPSDFSTGNGGGFFFRDDRGTSSSSSSSSARLRGLGASASGLAKSESASASLFWSALPPFSAAFDCTPVSQAAFADRPSA